MGGLISILQPKSRKQGEEELVTSGHFIPILVFWCIHFEIKTLHRFSCLPEHSSIKIDKYLKFLEMSMENIPHTSPIFCIKTISSILRVGVVIK